ncbi:regulatory protein RecX [Spiribacter sp. 221]|uniref:regulatory protein RecX n=1 Tax=Spiribacter onubensis TaxID=3122420 RepID=UPI00349F965B
MEEAEDDAAAIRDCSIRLLARREHSRLELQRKLEARDFLRGDIAAVLDALEWEGLLSDERFAEIFSRTRFESGQGPLRIRADLQARGVDSEIIDRVLELVDDSWLVHCRAAWRRRFGVAPADRREWSRQARFLSNRGFSAEHVRRVLDAVAEDDADMGS